MDRLINGYMYAQERQIVELMDIWIDEYMDKQKDRWTDRNVER